MEINIAFEMVQLENNLHIIIQVLLLNVRTVNTSLKVSLKLLNI